MAENNPWLSIPYADYERHMTDPGVGQLKLLNEIMAAKVKQFEPKTVAVLGASTGNGFEHFSDAELVYAIDINPDYLEVCKQRFGSYSNSLRCIEADIDHDDLGVPAGSVDLIICHLLLEYVDAGTALNKIKQVLSVRGILNVVIQENRNNSFVSDTGVTSLAPLSAFARYVEAKYLFDHPDFEVIAFAEHELPNGKVFKSFDLKLLPSGAKA